MIRSVIFDLDGTLLDTQQDLAKACNQALAEAGLPPQPLEAYSQMVGAGIRNLVLRAASAASRVGEEQIAQDLITRMLQSFNRAYSQCWAEATRPYPGITELLAHLRQAGLRLAILSNKDDSFTQDIVAHFFPGDGFDQVAGKLAGWPIKPDPALALEICRRLGVTPEETAFVGDSGSDMQTAVRAGLEPIGVLWGFRSREELLANGAVRLAGSTGELERLLIGGEPA